MFLSAEIVGRDSRWSARWGHIFCRQKIVSNGSRNNKVMSETIITNDNCWGKKTRHGHGLSRLGFPQLCPINLQAVRLL